MAKKKKVQQEVKRAKKMPLGVDPYEWRRQQLLEQEQQSEDK